jgi:hypothetical protein
VSARTALLVGSVFTSVLLATFPQRDRVFTSGLARAALLPGKVVLVGETPSEVTSGAATLVASASAKTAMTFDVILPFRNQTALASFIASQASHGIYLSHEQFDAEFGPSPAQTQAVKAWAVQYGFSTSYTSADGTTITLKGSTGAVERAFAVQINTYRSRTHGTYFAASSDPLVPANLGIAGVIGLDNMVEVAAHSQVIATTQSADIAEDAILAAVIWDGVTSIGRLGEGQRSIIRDHLATAGELLRTSNFWPAPAERMA